MNIKYRMHDRPPQMSYQSSKTHNDNKVKHQSYVSQKHPFFLLIKSVKN